MTPQCNSRLTSSWRQECQNVFCVVAIVGTMLTAFVAEAGETWVAVGYGGRRMISTDGLKWEITAEWAQPGGDDSNNLMSAVFAQNQFVVVGGGGGGKTGGGHILVSPNGREWTETHTDKSRINPIVFGADRYIVGTSSYPSGRLLWSRDAKTWQKGAAIETKGLTHFRGGAFGNELFVLVGNAGGLGGKSWAIATRDGEKVVSERDDLPGHGTIVFGAGRFLMLTSHSKADLIASKDGATWERVKFPDGTQFQWLVRAPQEFIVGDGKQAHRSADGVEWHKFDLTTRGDVKWSDGTRFITSSWPGKMAFSSDGKTWKDAPPLTANGINRVVFNPGKSE